MSSPGNRSQIEYAEKILRKAAEDCEFTVSAITDLIEKVKENVDRCLREINMPSPFYRKAIDHLQKEIAFESANDALNRVGKWDEEVLIPLTEYAWLYARREYAKKKQFRLVVN